MKKSVSLLLVVALISALAFPLDAYAAESYTVKSSGISSTQYISPISASLANSNASWEATISLVLRADGAPTGIYTSDSPASVQVICPSFEGAFGGVNGNIMFGVTRASLEAPDGVELSAWDYTWNVERFHSDSKYTPDTPFLKGSFDVSFNNASLYNGTVTIYIHLYGTIGRIGDANGNLGGKLSYSIDVLNNGQCHSVGGEDGAGLVVQSPSIESAINGVNGSVQEQTAQQAQQYQDEKDTAEQTGSDIQSSSSELEGLGGEEGKWKILWFPLTFTKQVIGVFTGANAVNIANEQVVGFRYDEETGMLIKVHSYDPIPIDDSGGSSTIPLPNVGSKITFPSVDLPIIGTVWEPYTFDLAEVKEHFPLVFNAIYLVVSVLEVYWFIGFLHDKYEEVFG